MAVKPLPPLPVAQILKRLLALIGIYAEKDPSLVVWVNGRRVTVRTFELVLRLLLAGIRATYIIEIEEPTIIGIEPEPFKIRYLALISDYDREKGFSEPRIFTDEEEILPKTTLEQLKDRMRLIAKKGKEVLEWLLIIRDILEVLGIPAP